MNKKIYTGIGVVLLIAITALYFLSGPEKEEYDFTNVDVNQLQEEAKKSFVEIEEPCVITLDEYVGLFEGKVLPETLKIQRVPRSSNLPPTCDFKHLAKLFEINEPNFENLVSLSFSSMPTQCSFYAAGITEDKKCTDLVDVGSSAVLIEDYNKTLKMKSYTLAVNGPKYDFTIIYAPVVGGFEFKSQAGSYVKINPNAFLENLAKLIVTKI